jgi:hypothetical protein
MDLLSPSHKVIVKQFPHPGDFQEFLEKCENRFHRPEPFLDKIDKEQLEQYRIIAYQALLVSENKSGCLSKIHGINYFLRTYTLPNWKPTRTPFTVSKL